MPHNITTLFNLLGSIPTLRANYVLTVWILYGYSMDSVWKVYG